MELGDQLIRWTVRLAMICYALTLATGPLSARRGWSTAGKLLWTAGCLLFWCHVLSAFHFYHHWSHAHAFADTAEKTATAIGWQFGWGIYVNHLFLIVWTADVLWDWLDPISHAARPRWVHLGLHAFLMFIALNGLAVFKSGTIRWVSLGVCVLLIAWRVWIWQRQRQIDITTRCVSEG